MMRRCLPWLAVLVAGCSPSLNWREVEGVAGPRWWFPCKPDRVERQVTIDGVPVPARLAVCDAQGASWSMMALQFPTPAAARQAEAAARAALRANLTGQEAPAPSGVALRGAAPQWWRGRRADGGEVRVAVRYAVQEGWLVQQVVMAPGEDAWPRSVDGPALDIFFDGRLDAR